jgi:Stigma-specific protein, Stig1
MIAAVIRPWRKCLQAARRVPVLLWIAGFCACVLPAPAAAQSPCGGENQRACCVLERVPSCNAGLFELGQPNSGRCGGFNPFGIQSSGVCKRITPCGGENQRACCVGEAAAACASGLVQWSAPNSGQCGNLAPGIQSSGTCRRITPCGGENQRACCVGEGATCASGLVQWSAPNSGQCGNLAAGIQSSGICKRITPCGGENQRACCVGEASSACGPGLAESRRANSGQCGNLAPGIQSSGICVKIQPCGGPLQRACCIGERPDIGACGANLAEAVESTEGPGCRRDEPSTDENCLCSGGLAQSTGVCVSTVEPPTSTCWTQEADKADVDDVALSLYVVGFNHSRIYERSRPADQAGVDELARVIESDAVSPTNVVVVFSASMWTGTIGSLVPACDAGDHIGGDGVPQAAECVAHRLDQAFAPQRFTVSDWPSVGALEQGGFAVVSGSRWSPVSTNRITTANAKSLRVRLKDRTSPAGTPAGTLNLYVVHTSGANCVAPACDEKNGCGEDQCRDVYKSKTRVRQEIEQVAEAARSEQRDCDWPPIIAGDFNAGIVADLNAFIGTTWHWLSHDKMCKTVDANGAETSVALNTGTGGGAVMQALQAGSDFGESLSSSADESWRTRGAMRLISQRYSSNADGTAAYPHYGIWLPNVKHNVVAVGLALGSQHPRCLRRACEGSEEFCDGDCVDTMNNPSHCGECERRCPGTARCLDGKCALGNPGGPVILPVSPPRRGRRQQRES